MFKKFLARQLSTGSDLREEVVHIFYWFRHGDSSTCYNFGEMYFERRGGKYNAKRTTYQGHTYHSAKEADYAAQLDLRIRAADWRVTNAKWP